MKVSKKTPIKILGGGIAGLSAGIFLKKAGFDPIIYEKNIQCGINRHGDIEGLETWNFNPNPIKFLTQLNIPLDFNFKPENQFTIHFDNFPSLKIKDNNPFFYYVKRGANKGDIDRELQTYALSIGCEIRFGFAPKKDNISIIATGSNKAKAFIQGVTFKTNLSDQTHLFLNSSLTKTGYAYLIIWNGIATLSVAYKKLEKDNNEIIERLIEICDSTLNIKIPNDSNNFASYGSFDIDAIKIDDLGKYYIGEAGGFQDYLFGFGMNSAIYSAYYAIKSFTTNINFQDAIEEKISPHMKASLVNRFFYEKLNEQKKYNICKMLSQSKNPLSILQKRSNYSLKKILMFKLLNQKLKLL